MTGLEYLISNLVEMNIIPLENKFIVDLVNQSLKMDNIKNFRIFNGITSFNEIKKLINVIFDGDVDGTASTHNNSKCRIAFTGYLTLIVHKPSNISKITNWKVGTVKDRLINHKNHMMYDKEYSDKFNRIVKNSCKLSLRGEQL